jgi:hypothetical protein
MHTMYKTDPSVLEMVEKCSVAGGGRKCLLYTVVMVAAPATEEETVDVNNTRAWRLCG